MPGGEGEGPTDGFLTEFTGFTGFEKFRRDNPKPFPCASNSVLGQQFRKIG